MPVLPLVAKKGDVALFSSDIWHRRLPTLAGDQGRFFLQCHYGRRDIAQRLRTTAQTNQVSEEAVARAETQEFAPRRFFFGQCAIVAAADVRFSIEVFYGFIIQQAVRKHGVRFDMGG